MILTKFSTKFLFKSEIVDAYISSLILPSLQLHFLSMTAAEKRGDTLGPQIKETISRPSDGSEAVFVNRTDANNWKVSAISFTLPDFLCVFLYIFNSYVNPLYYTL